MLESEVEILENKYRDLNKKRENALQEIKNLKDKQNFSSPTSTAKNFLLSEGISPNLLRRNSTEKKDRQKQNKGWETQRYAPEIEKNPKHHIYVINPQKLDTFCKTLAKKLKAGYKDFVIFGTSKHMNDMVEVERGLNTCLQMVQDFENYVNDKLTALNIKF